VLVTCPKCQKSGLSDAARACPYCGHPLQSLRDLAEDALNIQQSIRLEQEAAARRKQEREAESVRQQAEAERLYTDFQRCVQNVSSCQTGLDFIFRASPSTPGESNSILPWLPQIPNTLDEAEKCLTELYQKLKDCGITLDLSGRNKVKELLATIPSLRSKYAIIHLCLRLDEFAVSRAAEIEAAISSVDNFISSLPQHEKINPKKLDAHLQEAFKILESVSAECYSFLESSRRQESAPFSDYFKIQTKAILDKCQPVLAQYRAFPKTTVSGKAIASLVLGVLSICCLPFSLIVVVVSFAQQELHNIIPIIFSIVILPPFALLGVIAAVYGHLALRDIRANNLSGKKLATTALRLVYGGAIFFCAIMVIIRIIQMLV